MGSNDRRSSILPEELIPEEIYIPGTEYVPGTKHQLPTGQTTAVIPSAHIKCDRSWCGRGFYRKMPGITAVGWAGWSDTHTAILTFLPLFVVGGGSSMSDTLCPKPASTQQWYIW